jgi:hypothetical protein
MKQKLFLSSIILLLSIFSTSALLAQVVIKAGVNIASIAESAREETYQEFENKSVTGLQVGAAFDLAPSSAFSIQPELLYIQKGGKVGYELNEDNRIESRIYYNYVEVPVLAKLKIASESGNGLYFVGGPFVGLAISGKSKNTVTILGNTTTDEDKFEFQNDDPEERQKRADWGVSFGAGVKLGHFVLDARYNLGINNLLDSDADNQNDDKPYRRTRGIGLTLGYAF